ncbi:MAG: 2-C-methyl-D-erythritol 4-phosphate cytidylyltransferase [Pseudonocardiaceae bacterium]|nr:2-C-methyl-D-erythritol 4-phosphate cytidylyltransferase [Pseudonocardiaceae bacterium]
MALVPAAGRGLRLGADVPKAFARLRGRSLLSHAVGGLLGSGCVDRVVVAVGADDGALAEAALGDVTSQDASPQLVRQRVRLVIGGSERIDSVRAALDVVGGAEVILVHDAARCLVPLSVIRSVVEAVRAGHHAVIPVLPVADTVKQVDDSGVVIATVDRTALRVVQTPQAFEAGLLRRAYADAGGLATDDAGLVERLGQTVTTVPGHPHAFKITTAFDLTVAEALAGDR